MEAEKKVTLDVPVLQEMACSLGDYNYREIRGIYERQKMRVTPIENDVKMWLSQGVLVGQPLARYNGSYKVSISLELWPDVIRTIRQEQIPKLLANSPLMSATARENVGHFVSAFWAFLHGQPFVERLLRVEWTHVASKMPKLMTLLSWLSRRREYIVFMQQVDERVLSVIFLQDCEEEWLKLNRVGDTEVLHQVFLDNQLIPEASRAYFKDSYLYNYEFLLTGRLDDVLAKMTPGSEYYQHLSAIKLLHEGKAAEACDVLTEEMKREGVDMFEEPLTNFAYGVALGLTDTPKTRREADKLMKSRKLKGEDFCYAMMIALHHYVRGDAAEFVKGFPLNSCKDKMNWRLAVLFLKHYQVMDTDIPSITPPEELVATEGFDYLRLLYADDFPLMKKIADGLRKQTGLQTNLLPKVKKTERWERVIDQLQKLNQLAAVKSSSTIKPVTVDMERVAYVVNMLHYDVQPKLQKSKDGGITWSKGRNIALKSFNLGLEPCMTNQDRRVGSLVESYSYGWYGQVSYELGGAKVIAALVGCQSVYDARTEQRIDIVEEPLQLMVRPSVNGYSIRSNVDLKRIEAGVCITQQGDKQLTVIKVGTNQKKTLELFAEVGVFPLASKKRLTDLLKTLSGEFTVMSPLLKNADDLKHVEACPLIAVQIAPIDNQQFAVSLAVKPFGTHPPYQKPAQGVEILTATVNGEQVQTERDMKTEKKNLQTVRKMLPDDMADMMADNRWYIDTVTCLALLEQLRTSTDVAYAEWPQGVRMRVERPMITPDRFKLKISSVGQWFELEGEVSIGDKEKMKMADLLERLREADGNFIRLEDNEYIALSEQLRRQLQAIDQMVTGRGKQLKVSSMNGLQLQALEDLGVKVKADDTFRQLITRIRESESIRFTVPTNIHAELRPYQQQGFEWMSRLAHWGAGACLADDMGLGKTLQAITLMQSRASQGPQLVIMPTSVLLNWQAELCRFAPALHIRILNQQGADRTTIVSEAEAGDVVLSTYGLLVTEGELLCSRSWTTIVLDEAHSIKNRDTQTSKAAMQLQADFRLMLTGTPLQNHLSEIWNLFQFANPGLLGSYQQFTDRFILPVERDGDTDRQRLLRRLLSPFLLRRTKDDVLNELPEKTEITLRVELSADEQALYDNLRQQAIANLELGTKSPLQTLAEITRLRQAACHPRLIDDRLKIPSSKTAAFLNLVQELRQSGHRALVFSQFTSHLALIREALDNSPLFGKGEEGEASYLYLDGSTSAAERNRLVRQFQTGEQPLFLISLKAGGLGLNLTAADYVVHLDPWWNPAIEDQASDRAYRIGQERPVTVYRLIAANTIEEKIIRLHQNKRSLADALLQDADMFSQISADDVIRLLREGVEAVG